MPFTYKPDSSLSNPGVKLFAYATGIVMYFPDGKVSVLYPDGTQCSLVNPPPYEKESRVFATIGGDFYWVSGDMVYILKDKITHFCKLPFVGDRVSAIHLSRCSWVSTGETVFLAIKVTDTTGRIYYMDVRKLTESVTIPARIISVNPCNTAVCGDISAYHTTEKDDAGKITSYLLHIRDMVTGEEFTTQRTSAEQMEVYPNGMVRVGNEFLTKKEKRSCPGCKESRKQIGVVLPCECTTHCYDCAKACTLCPNCKETILKVISV